MIIDAHQHFWDLDRGDYPWMGPEHARLGRRFGPDELAPLLERGGITGTVAVQARTELEESRALLALAEVHAFVLGVVGWVDLTAPGVAHTLEELRALPAGNRLVGLRHVVHDEADPSWLLRPDVQEGLAALGSAGLTFDLLVRPLQLPAAVETAARHPGIGFVVDHLAKPPVRGADSTDWERGVRALANLPNVTCKLSGLVTEGDPSADADEVAAWFRRTLDVFGPERCMFGSDWPVCLVAAGYERVLELLLGAIDDLEPHEREAVLARTAIDAYGLDVRG